MSTMIETQTPMERLEPAYTPAPVPRVEITPEELLEMPDGGHYELVDGELKERKVSALSNLVALEISGILHRHCRAHDLGWLFASDHGYRCFPWKPRQVRRADVAFIRKERYTWEQLSSEGHTTVAPDLAVEVISPHDLASGLEEKVEEYLKAGVRLIWVVHPERRIVRVVRADGTGQRFRSDDELSGEDVVPGFQCRVADLFPAPPTSVTDGPPEEAAEAVAETQTPAAGEIGTKSRS